jgi:hypothetical protein
MVVVQLGTREKVNAFRAGVGDVGGIVTLGLDPKTFMNLAGLDALYLSLTRTERWGSHPLPHYSAALLRTTAEDQREGMPPYIVTGLLLEEGDPNTAAFAIPHIAKAVLNVVDEVNASNPRAIRTVGFFEFELSFHGTNLTEVGRVFAEALASCRR